MPAPASTQILPHVVARHAEDAAFEWLRRDRAVDAPHFQLRHLVKLDGRIEANLDGLRIAGDAGWDLVTEDLRYHEPGEMFLAGVLALESEDARRIALVIEKVMSAPEMARGLISALGWGSREAAASRLGELLASPSAVIRSVGIAGSVIHAMDPGFALVDAWTSDEPELRRRAFAAVGRLGCGHLLRAIDGHLDDPVPECRFWAGWSSGLLGSAAGVTVLRAMAETEGPMRELAAATTGRLLQHPTSLGWQRDLAHDPSGIRAAIVTAGSIGDPALVSWLIERMEEPTHARLAGEAFSMITGADLAAEHLDQQPPHAVGRPTESAGDESVWSDPDDDLVWPDRMAVTKWYTRARASLHSGTRYLVGRPLDEPSLLIALRGAYQRQRAAAAFELARARRPLFDVRAPGPRQLARLGAAPTGST